MTRLIELSVRAGRIYADQYPYADRQSCGDIRQVAMGHYTCTRREGHEGPHVANIADKTAVAAWDTEVKR